MMDPFSSTAQLWFLPPPQFSPWVARIDYYLNWQICKAHERSPFKMLSELRMATHEMDLPFFESHIERGAPLLVASQGLLPAHQCVVIDFSGPLYDWLSQIKNVAIKLNAHSLQIFLPHGSSIEEGQKLWRDLATPEQNAQFIAATEMQ